MDHHGCKEAFDAIVGWFEPVELAWEKRGALDGFGKNNTVMGQGPLQR
jgi:hypothetical protein